jgi:hypothetical protein
MESASSVNMERYVYRSRCEGGIFSDPTSFFSDIAAVIARTRLVIRFALACGIVATIRPVIAHPHNFMFLASLPRCSALIGKTL